MTISDRILKTIKKIALDRNIHEDSVSYQQIAVEQAIELNNLFELRKVSRTFKEKNTLSFDNYLQDFYKGNNGIYREIGTDYYYNIEEIRLKHKIEFKVEP